MTHKPLITYLFDPLCGWCYGASPALRRLAAHPGISIELAPTGLFSGSGARPMDSQFAAYAWSNDQRIAELSGQRFSIDYREKVLGQSGGRDQAVVASADDDGVEGAHAALPVRALPRSRRISRAALAPGAAMTPPPGWLDEPHM